MAHRNPTTGIGALAGRERRVIAVGAGIVALAVLIVFAVLPLARHWLARESALGSAQARVAYLESLAQRSQEIAQMAAAAELQVRNLPQRVVHARSEPLAASQLQTVLQDAANTHGLLVTRIEVTNTTDVRTGDTGPAGTNTRVGGTTSGGGVATFDVPATIAAYGDIIGVTGFLQWLSAGPQVVQFDRITLQRNSALLGAPDVVQLSFDIRAPVIRE